MLEGAINAQRQFQSITRPGAFNFSKTEKLHAQQYYYSCINLLCSEASTNTSWSNVLVSAAWRALGVVSASQTLSAAGWRSIASRQLTWGDGLIRQGCVTRLANLSDAKAHSPQTTERSKRKSRLALTDRTEGPPVSSTPTLQEKDKWN